MSAAHLIVVLLTAAAQPGEDAAARPVSVRMIALEAQREDRERPYFAPGTEEAREAVGDLPFDTYRLVRAATVTAPFGEPTVVKINERYSLHLTPLSKEQGGRVKAEVRVTLPPKKRGEKRVSVVATTVIAAPGQRFKLRGMRLEEGELVVVLAIKP